MNKNLKTQICTYTGEVNELVRLCTGKEEQPVKEIYLNCSEVYFLVSLDAINGPCFMVEQYLN